jgi:hypothetical protein
MWDDYALQRAVSVIMWALIQHHDDATAMAKAQAREPQLTDREIRLAWQWAHAGIRAAALLREAGPEDTLADVLDRAGVPWRQVQ